MPVFEYVCRSCGEKFKEYRRLVWSDKEIKCPKCGTPHPERVKRGKWDEFLFIFEGGAPSGGDHYDCAVCDMANTCPARRPREPESGKKPASKSP